MIYWGTRPLFLQATPSYSTRVGVTLTFKIQAPPVCHTRALGGGLGTRLGQESSYRSRFEDSTSDESSNSSFSKSSSPEKEGEGELLYHTIVIDCAPIGFADSMGITVLEQVQIYIKHEAQINLLMHQI